MILLKHFRFSEKKCSGFRGHFYKTAAGPNGFFLLKKKALISSYLFVYHQLCVSLLPEPKVEKKPFNSGMFDKSQI